MPPSYGLYVFIYRKITLDYVPLKTIQFLSEHFFMWQIVYQQFIFADALYCIYALLLSNTILLSATAYMSCLSYVSFFSFFYLAVYSIRSYLYFWFCYYYCTLVSFYILDFILYRTVDVYISMGNLNIQKFIRYTQFIKYIT